jgi:hypothetical protein
VPFPVLICLLLIAGTPIAIFLGCVLALLSLFLYLSWRT